MPDGFKIADGYVAVVAKIDRQAVNRAADEAGQEAGDSFTGGMDGRLRDERGRSARIFTDTFGVAREPAGRGGDDSGRGFLDNFGKAFSGGFLETITAGFKGGGGLASAFSSNPYVAGVGAALAGGIVAVALPAIGAGITAGLGLGAGLGVIGIGALLLKDEPAVKDAGTKLGETFVSTMKEAAKPLIGPFVGALNTLKGLITDISPQLKEMFATVAPFVQPLADGFAGMVQNAMPGFLDFLKASGPMLTELAKHMPEIGKALSVFFSALSDGGPGATKFLGDLLGFLESQIVLWGHLIGWLSMAYGAIHDFFADIPGWLSSAGQWFEDTWHKVEDFFTGLWDSATNLVSGWGDTLQGWVDATGQKVDAVVDWFGGLPDRVMAWLEALPGRMGDWAGTAFDAVLYGIGFGIGSIVDFFVRLPGRAVDAVSTLGERLSGWWTTVSTNVTTWVSGTVDGVVDYFTKLPGRASDALSSLWDTISGRFTQTRDNANSTIRDAVNGAVDWLSGLPHRAWSAVSGLPGEVGRAVSGAGSWLWSAGQDVIRGLVNGIEGMMGWAVDKARHAASRIADGFKDALGIHSPSTLMRDEVGAMLPPGAVEGFEKALPAAQRKLAGLAPSLVQGAVPAMAVSATEGGGGRGITIGTLEIKGVWDFTNPAAVRAMIATLHESLAAYQREYA